MSRKYRHNGYQDDDRQRERHEHEQASQPSSYRNLTPEERIQRRSLRRATTREANEVVRCHVCGRNVPNFGTIRPDSACPHCSATLHCCRTCRHFDTSARWQCRASISEPVTAKMKANDCASYVPRLVLDSTGRRSSAGPASPAGRPSNDPKTQFENLFKR